MVCSYILTTSNLILLVIKRCVVLLTAAGLLSFEKANGRRKSYFIQSTLAARAVTTVQRNEMSVSKRALVFGKHPFDRMRLLKEPLGPWLFSEWLPQRQRLAEWQGKTTTWYFISKHCCVFMCRGLGKVFCTRYVYLFVYI